MMLDTAPAALAPAQMDLRPDALARKYQLVPSRKYTHIKYWHRLFYGQRS